MGLITVWYRAVQPLNGWGQNQGEPGTPNAICHTDNPTALCRPSLTASLHACRGPLPSLLHCRPTPTLKLLQCAPSWPQAYLQFLQLCCTVQARASRKSQRLEGEPGDSSHSCSQNDVGSSSWLDAHAPPVAQPWYVKGSCMYVKRTCKKQVLSSFKCNLNSYCHCDHQGTPLKSLCLFFVRYLILCLFCTDSRKKWREQFFHILTG